MLSFQTTKFFKKTARSTISGCHALLSWEHQDTSGAGELSMGPGLCTALRCALQNQPVAHHEGNWGKIWVCNTISSTDWFNNLFWHQHLWIDKTLRTFAMILSGLYFLPCCGVFACRSSDDTQMSKPKPKNPTSASLRKHKVVESVSEPSREPPWSILLPLACTQLLSGGQECAGGKKKTYPSAIPVNHRRPSPQS